ncbi:TolC family protein [Sulfurimonas aquatica]|uniref:TolC family protein n=1 Tax=Sulfurimonas aquatica TaxID=2672570 RepID=UPI001A98A4C7|nr:TolC family protein [Sulfurimonas aquatica]
MRYFLALQLLLVELVSANELFKKEMILEYFKESNPFVYSAIANENRYKNRDLYYQGELDNKLFLKYDKKEYPVSEAEFFDIGVQKPLENGIELTLAYRKAEGTQESNNIKTGDDGEARVGVKLPLFSLAHGMNDRKLNIETARLQRVNLSNDSKNNLRILYFKTYSEYAKVLYYKAVIELQKELLNKAKKRESIVSDRVNVGSVAEVALLEAQQQIINREQSLISSENEFSYALENFLKYLNISREEFESQYRLFKLEEIEHAKVDYDEFLGMALENRPDLKKYDIELKKIKLEQKQTNLLNYPKMDLSFYGVHDFEYESGFKVALDMDFPIERRKYDAKVLENKNSVLMMQTDKAKEILNIKTNLLNIVNSLNTIEMNLASSKKEIELLETLEKAENKKYVLGMSNLFMVNQREVYTLEVKKKALKYNFKYLLLEQEAQREAGFSFKELRL